MSKTCAWHKCGKRFSAPRRGFARFCSNKCRADEKNWRMMRGAIAVNPLLAWRAWSHWGAEHRAAYRVEHGITPLVQVQLMVDGWAAEKKNDTP